MQSHRTALLSPLACFLAAVASGQQPGPARLPPPLEIAEEPTHVAVASKMLYSSHYFWTAIELRVLVPDPSRGDGFWFASVNRSRSDGLSGFVGKLIRGKVRSEAEKGMAAALAITKTRMEGH